MTFKRYIVAAMAAGIAFAASPASADTYDFTFLGANYSASGSFTTGAADTANDGGFNIIALTGTLTSANPLLFQGDFSLTGSNAPDVTTADWLLSADGAYDYSNLYVPGSLSFAGGGFLASGTGLNGTFELNIFNAIASNYPSCGASDCASVAPDQGLYNPGDLGVVTISAVPEPASWAMMLLGFGGIGFMLRGSRRKESALAKA
ncbi:MAG TPA: PEPxxWA-CTERM sorting domain-containing protein [Rhizomicrobium sp.]|jgi:hypothetical protein|nr:PEPxxWA-CTERM sorting domain-containing protein [Rhizomicrobium sp.]